MLIKAGLHLALSILIAPRGLVFESARGAIPTPRTPFFHLKEAPIRAGAPLALAGPATLTAWLGAELFDIALLIIIFILGFYCPQCSPRPQRQGYGTMAQLRHS